MPWLKVEDELTTTIFMNCEREYEPWSRFGMHLVQTGADVSLALTTTLWKTKDCEGLCCPLLGWGTDPTGYSWRMLPQAVMKTTHRQGPYSFHLDGASEGLSKESYSLTSTRRPTVRVKVQEPSKGMWSLLRHVGLCIG